MFKFTSEAFTSSINLMVFLFRPVSLQYPLSHNKYPVKMKVCTEPAKHVKWLFTFFSLKLKKRKKKIVWTGLCITCFNKITILIHVDGWLSWGGLTKYRVFFAFVLWVTLLEFNFTPHNEIQNVMISKSNNDGKEEMKITILRNCLIIFPTVH